MKSTNSLLRSILKNKSYKTKLYSLQKYRSHNLNNQQNQTTQNNIINQSNENIKELNDKITNNSNNKEESNCKQTSNKNQQHINQKENESLFSINKESNTHEWGKDRIQDTLKFKEVAYQMIEDIIEFNKNINNTRVVPNVKPKFLKDKLDFSKININDSYCNISKELKSVILPNMTLWNHPRFLNWYPSMTSFPAILGNLITNSFETPNNKYELNKITNELEIKVVQWMAELMNLPLNFRDFDNKSGGYVNFAAGEISIIAALAGKAYKIRQFENDYSIKDKDSVVNINKLRFYYSSHAHYSVKKGINIAGAEPIMIPVSWNNSRSNYEMDIDYLSKKIESDIENGFIPAYVCGTIGTTGTAGVDNIKKLSELKSKYDFWLHIDAAYSGNTFMLEEYKYLLEGVDKGNSICINGNKWTPVSENSGWFYFSDRDVIASVFKDIKSSTNDSNKAITSLLEITDYELFSSRVNKSIRLYSVINSFGVDKYKEIVRRYLRCAKIFEKRLSESKRFEVICPAEFALVCFNLGTRERTKRYMEFINNEPVLSIGPYDLPDSDKDKGYILRISINYLYVTEENSQKDAEYLINAYDRCFGRNEKI